MLKIIYMVYKKLKCCLTHIKFFKRYLNQDYSRGAWKMLRICCLTYFTSIAPKLQLLLALPKISVVK